MVSQNGRTASGRPRSGSLAYLDAGLDQVLGSPLRLATSTKRRIVLNKLPDASPGQAPRPTSVSVSETLFLVPSSFRPGCVGAADRQRRNRVDGAWVRFFLGKARRGCGGSRVPRRARGPGGPVRHLARRPGRGRWPGPGPRTMWHRPGCNRDRFTSCRPAGGLGPARPGAGRGARGRTGRPGRGRGARGCRPGTAAGQPGRRQAPGAAGTSPRTAAGPPRHSRIDQPQPRERNAPMEHRTGWGQGWHGAAELYETHGMLGDGKREEGAWCPGLRQAGVATGVGCRGDGGGDPGWVG